MSITETELPSMFEAHARLPPGSRSIPCGFPGSATVATTVAEARSTKLTDFEFVFATSRRPSPAPPGERLRSTAIPMTSNAKIGMNIFFTASARLSKPAPTRRRPAETGILAPGSFPDQTGLVSAATNYGERLLAGLEFRAARRRRFVLLLPATAVAFWAIADLAAARHGRLVAQDAGAMRQWADHLALGLWTLALVVGGMATALKPRRVPAGALVAILAGPILTPIIFRGGGGWHPWQTVLFVLLALPGLAPRRPG